MAYTLADAGGGAHGALLMVGDLFNATNKLKK